jgi:colanic acid/amylovoran biosynthesis glycosyltransferase
MKRKERQDGIRVLHLIERYLPTTQHWMYPQVVDVPGTQSAVYCNDVMNLSEYPLDGRPIFSASEINGSQPTSRLVRAATRRIRALSSLWGAHSWRPSLLHAHFGTIGWRSLFQKRLFRVPLITSFYGVEAWELPVGEPVWRDKFERLFSSGDLFLVEGPAMRQRLVDLGAPKAKVRVRTLGIDLGSLRWSARSLSAGLRIVMVGRFVEKKGLPDGLRACALAAKSGIPLSVTIVGDAGADPAGQAIKRELVALATSVELAGKVTFAGYLSHAETLTMLDSHNVIFCPSRHAASGDAEGGLPYVLTEGMAMGLIGVGSHHCDIPEAIVDGRTGLLFEEKNVPAMAAALEKLFQDTDVAAMAVAARQHVADHFDQSKQLRVLAGIYEEVAEGRDRA